MLGRLVSYQSQLWIDRKSAIPFPKSGNIVTIHGSCFINVTHKIRAWWLCSRPWRSLHFFRVVKVANQPRIESSLLFRSIGRQCVGSPLGIPTSGLSSLMDGCLGGGGFKFIGGEMISFSELHIDNSKHSSCLVTTNQIFQEGFNLRSGLKVTGRISWTQRMRSFL